MGGAIEGAVPWRHLALIVLGFIVPALSEAAFATSPGGGNSYMQNGSYIPIPPLSARQPRGSAILADPYGSFGSGGWWNPGHQISNNNLHDAQAFSFKFDDVREPDVTRGSHIAPGTGSLFKNTKSTMSGTKKHGAYEAVSAVELADKLKQGTEDERAERKESDDIKDSEVEEEPQKGGSQGSQEERSTAESADSEKATSTAAERGSPTTSPHTGPEEDAGTEDTTKQVKPQGANGGDSNIAESKEEEKEDEGEESEEGNNQTKEASSSQAQASPSEQQAVAKATSAPGGEAQDAENGGGESTSDSSEAGEKPQTEEESAKAESQSASGSPQAQGKPQAEEESESKESEPTSSSSATESKSAASDKPESENTESTSEGAEAEGQSQSGKAANNEGGESRSEAPEAEGPPQSSKEPETEKSESELVAPQNQVGKSTETAGEAQVSERSDKEATPTSATAPPQPSQERDARPSTPVEEPQHAVPQQDEKHTGTQPIGTAAEKPEGSPSAGAATTPAEESRSEGVEGIPTGRMPVLAGEGKCYSDIVQEALSEDEALRKNAHANGHFQEADQAFCDEIFRRIDGPYSLAELSALLRAADVADSPHRNFRYCRATPTSSPPRVKDGDSILHASISARKPHVTEVLLQYGAFPELPAIPQTKVQPDKNVMFPFLASNAESANIRPLHLTAAIQSLDSIESMELLLQYGAKANSRDTLGRTPLMFAAYQPKPHSHEFVKKLILSGADVNATDKAGLNALHYAAASDNWQVVRILLDHGADPTAADTRGNTPLHYAAAFNSYTSTTKLLEKGDGVNINAPNANGKAPIHLAAAPDAFQAVPRAIVPALALEALLMHHANPMARDAEGNNPLHLAALGGYVEILRRLVSFTQIPAEEKNAAGLTPLAAARQAVQGPILTEVEHFLEVYGEKKSCIEPPVVRHSTRIFSDTVLGPYMRVGDTVTYTCNPGFQMYGHPTVICQERDGKMEFVPNAPLCNLQTVSSTASPAYLPGGPIAAFAMLSALFYTMII